MPRNVFLADLITLPAIRALADPKSFERGNAYYHDGVVSRLTERDATVSATVRARIAITSSLRWAMTAHWITHLPVGDDGAFCKHRWLSRCRGSKTADRRSFTTRWPRRRGRGAAQDSRGADS